MYWYRVASVSRHLAGQWSRRAHSWALVSPFADQYLDDSQYFHGWDCSAWRWFMQISHLECEKFPHVFITIFEIVQKTFSLGRNEVGRAATVGPFSARDKTPGARAVCLSATALDARRHVTVAWIWPYTNSCWNVTLTSQVEAVH